MAGLYGFGILFALGGGMELLTPDVLADRELAKMNELTK